MMGSQEGKHSVARSGYDVQFLGYHLNEAGFAEYERVPEFHMFKDDSSKMVKFLALAIFPRPSPLKPPFPGPLEISVTILEGVMCVLSLPVLLAL